MKACGDGAGENLTAKYKVFYWLCVWKMTVRVCILAAFSEEESLPRWILPKSTLPVQRAQPRGMPSRRLLTTSYSGSMEGSRILEYIQE